MQSSVSKASELNPQTDKTQSQSVQVRKSIKTGIASSETQVISFEAFEPNVATDVDENKALALPSKDQIEVENFQNISKEMGV